MTYIQFNNQPPKNKVGFWRIVGHLILIGLTGGLWLIWLIVAALLKYIRKS
jgi:hypothetical protein